MHCRLVAALNDKIKNRSENQEPSGRTIAASYCKEFRSCAAGIGSTGANLIILKSARQRAGQIAKPFGKIELHCRELKLENCS
jgi:hypothetical protein